MMGQNEKGRQTTLHSLIGNLSFRGPSNLDDLHLPQLLVRTV